MTRRGFFATLGAVFGASHINRIPRWSPPMSLNVAGIAGISPRYLTKAGLYRTAQTFRFSDLGELDKIPRPGRVIEFYRNT